MMYARTHCTQVKLGTHLTLHYAAGEYGNERSFLLIRHETRET